MHGAEPSRVCLINNKTLHGSGEHHSHYCFHFFTFFNNNSHQNILTFFIFYITSIIFYYYLNKKIHYNTKFFHFSIQILFTLYHIITFTNFKTNNPLLCTVLFFAKQL
jgi:hypothetical protein